MEESTWRERVQLRRGPSSTSISDGGLVCDLRQNFISQWEQKVSETKTMALFCTMLVEPVSI